MTAEELGLYWLICLLIYSHGGPIKYDEKRFGALLAGTHWRTIRAASRRLQDLGKITSEHGQVMAKGCSGPLQDAVSRVSRAVENGLKGGRPPNKNNDLPEPEALHGEKLARVAPSPSLPPSSPPPKVFRSNEFDKFWDQCPKKVGKGKARTAYTSALSKTAPATLDAAMARYAAIRANEPEQYTLHPATWLNQERWLDETKTNGNGSHMDAFNSPEEIEAQRLAKEKAYGIQPSE